MNNNISGYILRARAVKRSAEGYPIAVANDLQGGLHVYDTLEDMNQALTGSTQMLELGMIGYVKPTDTTSGDTYFKLTEDGETLKWVELEFNGGGGGGETPKFDNNAVYFISANGNYINEGVAIPTSGGGDVSGYTATTEMSHSFDCTNASNGVYVYFAIPKVNGSMPYFFTINGNLITAYESKEVDIPSSVTGILYRLDNKMSGKKIVLNVQEDN